MKPRWAALLIVAGSLTAMPSMAAKTLSIEQMEQLLTKFQGKPDGKVASELDDVQLTERVSMARLERWNKEFPGSRTHEHLMKLADLSAFLNPPASDVLRNPPPDTETEERMLWMAVQYVKKTLSRLPDFFATRETTHFEDSLPQHATYSMGEVAIGRGAINVPMQTGGEGGFRGPTQRAGDATATEFKALHSTGAFSTTVTYRDGREVRDEGKQKKEEPPVGLTSHGEFGPILGAVIGDLVQSGVRWLRWEQGDGEPLAVFQYSVAANDSHFRVGIPVGNKVEEVLSAYHGEIDPATGEIRRLSEVADMVPPHQAMRAAITVEYAPVNIGGRNYMCPVRAVAYSKIQIPSTGSADADSWPVQTGLNDIAFTHYHEFGSEAKVVPGAGADYESTAAAGNEPSSHETNGSTESTSSTVMAEVARARSPSPAAADTAAVANAAPTSTAEAATPLVSRGPTATTETAGAPVAASPADISKGPWPTGTVIRAKSNLVLVDVAVTDHERPVKGLDRSRFHIFEDGRESPIASFEEKAPVPTSTVAEPPVLPANTYSNAPMYPDTGSVNVLLLDALNTSTSDLEQVRKQMIAFLGTVKPGMPLAVFSLASRLRQVAGFTTDIAKLTQAARSRKTSERAAADVGSGSGESLSSSLKQQASSVATSNDPGSLWLASEIEQFAADTKSYENGQRVMITLDALTTLARFLAAIPGRKNLIWFSGSFPIDMGPEATQRTPIKDMDDYKDAVLRMTVLMTAARVAVYPVDARGLMNAPSGDASYIPGPAGPSAGKGGDRTSVAVSNDNRNFAVQVSEDHGSMQMVAAQTGGHFYPSGNDLKSAVDKIVANDSYYYALSYVPPEEPGGKHDQLRRIEVKVDGAKYQLAYRQGYYPEDANRRFGGEKGTSLLNDAAELGAPQATQILFRARVLPKGDPQIQGPVPDEGTASAKAATIPVGAHPYVVDLSIDPQSLTLAEEADGTKRVQFKCALAAYNSEGEAVNSLGRAFDLKLPAAQVERLLSAGNSVPVRLALDLPAGDVALRIVVLDSASAKTGSLEIPIQVSSGQTGRPSSSLK